LGFRPAAGANSAALSFWEPASSLLVCPDDAYAVNADLKQVCLQKALAINALEESKRLSSGKATLASIVPFPESTGA
jgi:hypothetical protein